MFLQLTGNNESLQSILGSDSSLTRIADCCYTETAIDGVHLSRNNMLRIVINLYGY